MFLLIESIEQYILMTSHLIEVKAMLFDTIAFPKFVQ